MRCFETSVRARTTTRWTLTGQGIFLNILPVVLFLFAIKSYTLPFSFYQQLFKALDLPLLCTSPVQTL